MLEWSCLLEGLHLSWGDHQVSPSGFVMPLVHCRARKVFLSSVIRDQSSVFGILLCICEYDARTIRDTENMNRVRHEAIVRSDSETSYRHVSESCLIFYQHWLHQALSVFSSYNIVSFVTF